MAEQPSAINIVFDGPPGPDPPRFIEVEDDTGRSINIGHWHERDDGYWALRITWPSDTAGAVNSPPPGAMGVLRPPVALALARDERRVPAPDPRWVYEPKFDFCAWFGLLDVGRLGMPLIERGSL